MTATGVYQSKKTLIIPLIRICTLLVESPVPLVLWSLQKFFLDLLPIGFHIVRQESVASRTTAPAAYVRTITWLGVEATDRWFVSGRVSQWLVTQPNAS
jgi:hypothetical protein